MRREKKQRGAVKRTNNRGEVRRREENANNREEKRGEERGTNWPVVVCAVEVGLEHRRGPSQRRLQLEAREGVTAFRDDATVSVSVMREHIASHDIT